MSINYLVGRRRHTRCKAMLHGISQITIPINMSWFPKLMVSWVTLMSLAKPPVRALARFMRSNWKTRRPRNRSGRTEESILEALLAQVPYRDAPFEIGEEEKKKRKDPYFRRAFNSSFGSHSGNTDEVEDPASSGGVTSYSCFSFVSSLIVRVAQAYGQGRKYQQSLGS